MNAILSVEWQDFELGRQIKMEPSEFEKKSEVPIKIEHFDEGIWKDHLTSGYIDSLEHKDKYLDNECKRELLNVKYEIGDPEIHIKDECNISDDVSE